MKAVSYRHIPTGQLVLRCPSLRFCSQVILDCIKLTTLNLQRERPQVETGAELWGILAGDGVLARPEAETGPLGSLSH